MLKKKLSVLIVSLCLILYSCNIEVEENNNKKNYEPCLTLNGYCLDTLYGEARWEWLKLFYSKHKTVYPWYNYQIVDSTKAYNLLSCNLTPINLVSEEENHIFIYFEVNKNDQLVSSSFKSLLPAVSMKTKKISMIGNNGLFELIHFPEEIRKEREAVFYEDLEKHKKHLSKWLYEEARKRGKLQ